MPWCDYSTHYLVCNIFTVRITTQSKQVITVSNTRGTGSSSIVTCREGGVLVFLENAPIATLEMTGKVKVRFFIKIQDQTENSYQLDFVKKRNDVSEKGLYYFPSFP